jgi:hypothetical protein
VCPTALAQQIPYFERINPEGICIATYMNASTNLGVISAALYLLYVKFIGPIPHIVAVPVILASSAIAAYLVSAVHATTFHGMSVSLFICCAIGGSAGALASVVMNPFLTRYKDDFITASRSGGSMCIVLTAVLAAIQNPGSRTPHFSPTYYLLIVAIMLSFPIFAFMHIIRYKIGLRNENVIGSMSGHASHHPSVVDDDSTLLISHSKGNRGFRRSFIAGSSNERGGAEEGVEVGGVSQSKGGNDYDRISSSAAHDIDNIGSEDNLRQPIISPLHIMEKNNGTGQDKSTEIPSSSYVLSDVCEANKIIGVLDSNRNIGEDVTDYGEIGQSRNRYENGYDDRDGDSDRDSNTSVNGNGHNGHNDGSGSTTNHRSTAPLTTSEKLIHQIVKVFISNPSAWVLQVAPLCAVIGFVNMNTWGILTAVAPFAFKNVGTGSISGSGSGSGLGGGGGGGDGDGAMLLGYAYEFAAVCLMIGDLSTAVLRLPTHWGLFFFTVLTSAVYIAALPTTTPTTPTSPSTLSTLAPVLLILCYSLGRFFEAHIVTSTYRKIASEFHPSHRERAARVVGAMDMISTTMGSITSSILIATYASCKA